MAFEVNRGQARSGVDFVAAGANYGIALRAGRATLRLSHGLGPNRPNEPDAAQFSIELLGATLSPVSEPEEKLAGKSNYLFGSDPNKWITDVAHYAKVRYANIYPGIDVVYYGNQDRLEHDFVVHPGVNPGQIQLALSGVQRKELNRQGDLVLQVPGGEVKLERPNAYQQIGTRRIEVAAEYVLRDGQARFRLGRYDRSRDVVIDPVLAYSTFLGGAFPANGTSQSANGIALDGSGNLYVAGFTFSTDFPVTPGVVGQTPSAAFVSKINPAGTALLYSTYIGGMGGGGRLGLVVDASGNVYLAGESTTGLPIPPGSTPFQATASGLHVAILKLNSAASAVLYATYLGGSAEDDFASLAVDTSGNAYILGTTSSNDFPTNNPLQGSLGSAGRNAFVSKLNPTGTALVYSTYLGQSSSVLAGGIALDASNDAYVVGGATAGFPTTPGAFQQTWLAHCPSCSNAFLAKLNPSGSALLYATYFGGDANPSDELAATAVAVDASANVFLTGGFASSNFPVVNPVQTCFVNGAFVSEFDATGALKFSTCLGVGAANPVIALDASGNVYVSSTSDASLPLVNPIDANGEQAARPFISEINPATHTMLFSSFVGRVDLSNRVATGETINGIAVDSTGNIYLAGMSQLGISVGDNFNDLFPIFNALQPEFGNVTPCTLKSAVGCPYSDAIIMKISPAAGAAAAVAPSQLTFFTPQQVNTTSASQTVNVYDLGTDPLTVSSATVTGDFAIQSGCGSVAPSGGTCAIQVTFTPTATGTRNGTLTIDDSSPGSPHTVALSGEAAVPSATLSPSVLTFPPQPLGTTSAPQIVTITSTGAIGLVISRIQTSGPFAETNNCGASINSCTVSVTFSPTSENSATGTLEIIDNTPDSPHTIALSGTGGSATLGLGVATGSSSSATVNAGASAAYKLSVGGEGVGGTASLNCTGAPVGATCSVPASISISAATVSTFDVSVTTTSRSMAMLHQGGFLSATWPWTVAMIGWVSLLGRKPRQRSARPWLLLSLIFLLTFFSSCGGGGSSSGDKTSGTPAGSYTLTVTAKSGSATQSTNLTLTVQ